MSDKRWINICSLSDLVENSGVCALVEGATSADNLTAKDKQIALFSLPSMAEQVFAIDNFDPIGKANVLYRGMVGCNQGEPIVASPLYKQQFSLKTGQCLQEEAQVNTYPTRITDDCVEVLV